MILDYLAIPFDFLFHILIVQIFQSATMILCNKVVTACQKIELLIVRYNAATANGLAIPIAR